MECRVVLLAKGVQDAKGEQLVVHQRHAGQSLEVCVPMQRLSEERAASACLLLAEDFPVDVTLAVGHDAQTVQLTSDKATAEVSVGGLSMELSVRQLGTYYTYQRVSTPTGLRAEFPGEQECSGGGWPRVEDLLVATSLAVAGTRYLSVCGPGEVQTLFLPDDEVRAEAVWLGAGGPGGVRKLGRLYEGGGRIQPAGGPGAAGGSAPHYLYDGFAAQWQIGLQQERSDEPCADLFERVSAQCDNARNRNVACGYLVTRDGAGPVVPAETPFAGPQLHITLRASIHGLFSGAFAVPHFFAPYDAPRGGALPITVLVSDAGAAGTAGLADGHERELYVPAAAVPEDGRLRVRAAPGVSVRIYLFRAFRGLLRPPHLRRALCAARLRLARAACLGAVAGLLRKVRSLAGPPGGRPAPPPDESVAEFEVLQARRVPGGPREPARREGGRAAAGPGPTAAKRQCGAARAAPAAPTALARRVPRPPPQPLQNGRVLGREGARRGWAPPARAIPPRYANPHIDRLVEDVLALFRRRMGLQVGGIYDRPLDERVMRYLIDH